MSLPVNRLVVSLIVLVFSVLFAIRAISIYTSSTHSEHANNEIRIAKQLESQHVQTNSDMRISPHSNTFNIVDIETNSLLIKYKPDWTLEGKFKDHFQHLRRLSSRGDAMATFVLAMNLKRCVFIPVNSEEYAIKQLEIAEINDAGESMTRLSERYEFCEAITKEARDQYFIYLNKSAELGNVFAMEAIAAIPSQYYMRTQATKSLSRDEFIAIREHFDKQKQQYIQTAAQNGSMFALKQWSREHSFQNFGEHGGRHTYAINQVIMELTDSNDTFNQYDWFQQKLREQLSIEDIEKAQAIADNLLVKIRKNGTLYPH